MLTAEYATSYVEGMQQTKTGKNGKPYLKMLSYLKHYTACNAASGLQPRTS